MRAQSTDTSTLWAQFAEQGYAHMPDLGASPAEFAEVGAILDQLFDRYDELPRRFASDLGLAANEDGRAALPEIIEVSTLAPELRRTAVYRAAHRMARRLLGPGTYLKFDHAIYKPPGAAGTTSWHQYSGYDTTSTTGLAVWIPLQDTHATDGAMRYVPGSHLGGPLPHLSRVNDEGKPLYYLDVDEADAAHQPCALGGAIAHHLHTIHGAGPNLGPRVRRALILDFSTAPLPQRSVAALVHRLRSGRHAVL